MPSGVLIVVTNAPGDPGQVVSALITAPVVRRINFTGSTAFGRIIANQAGQHLKSVLFEPGVKARISVLDDADIEAAVNVAAFGAFMNQWQICMSSGRVILHDAIANEFVAEFATKVAPLPAGNPSDQFALGSLVCLDALEKMDALFTEAVENGLKVVAGGKCRTTFVEANLVDGVSSNKRIKSVATKMLFASLMTPRMT